MQALILRCAVAAVLGLAALGGLWLAIEGQVAWAIGYVCIMLAAHGLLIGCQFSLAWCFSRHGAIAMDPPHRLLQAWWNEVRVATWVFGWLQPWRASSCPDVRPHKPTPGSPKLAGPPRGVGWAQPSHGGVRRSQGCRGLILVHGYMCNRGMWNPWLARCEAAGIACIAVILEPVFGDIDAYVPVIDRAVQEMWQLTGRPPLLVCHSMGGLAARAWQRSARRRGLDLDGFQFVTIGTPHQGTVLARLGLPRNARQMRPDSDWLKELHAHEIDAEQGTPDQARAAWVCYLSSADNVVFPPERAIYPGAQLRVLHGIGHLAMVYDPVLVQTVLEMATEVGMASPLPQADDSPDNTPRRI